VFRERDAGGKPCLVVSDVVEVSRGGVGLARLGRGEIAAFHRHLSGRPLAGLVLLTGVLRKLGARLRQTSDAVQTLVRAL
jgi:hypothetical protein